jgi:hypothetical protein
MNDMNEYLVKLLTEKGITEDVENDMNIEGQINLTYQMQIDFICKMPLNIQKQIRDIFVKIDFQNGNVRHFWDHLTRGMLDSLGY